MKVKKITILALDQSTVITGYSVFSNKNLVEYGLLKAKKEDKPVERIYQTHKNILSLIEKINPDFIVFEDCQFQKRLDVFQTLSQLQGILMAIMFTKDLGFVIIESTAWKSFCGIKGRVRAEQKKDTQRFIKESFGYDCKEDEADAISIGWWAVNNIKEEVH